MSDNSKSNGISIFLIFIVIAIFSSMILTALTHKSKEEVMTERIVILKKAKDSNVFSCFFVFKIFNRNES